MEIPCNSIREFKAEAESISAVDLVGSMPLHEVQLTTSYGHRRISSTMVFSAA